MTTITVGGVPAAPVTSGKVFYVDLKSGADTSDGTNRSYPLRTIEAAMAMCRSGYGDVIYICAPGENADGGESQDITSTITIEKDGIAIVGLGANENPTGGCVGLDRVGNGNLFDIQADKVRIENLRLHLLGTGSGIKITGEDGVAAQTHIKNVAVVGDSTSNIGIEIAGNLYRSTIEQVKIDGLSGSIQKGIATSGTGQMRESIIRDCYITGGMDNGIQIGTSVEDVIQRCVVVGPTASIGVTGATSCVIDCKSDVAPSGTALKGGNTTVA